MYLLVDYSQRYKISRPVCLLLIVEEYAVVGKTFELDFHAKSIVRF